MVLQSIASPVVRTITPAISSPVVRTITPVAPAPVVAPSPVRVFANPNPVPLPFAPVAPVTTPVRVAAQPLPAAPQPIPVVSAQPLPVTPQPIPVVSAQPVPIATRPITVANAAVPSSQFHAQDEFGGFTFGYSNENSAKQELHTPDGVTQGSYSYVDANGVTQTVQYVADPINGFRVAGTNIPVADVEAPAVPVMDTDEVKAAKAEFQAAFDEAVARNAAVDEAERKKRSAEPITNDYELPLAPLVPAPAPVPAVTVVTSGSAPFVEPPARLLPFAPLSSPFLVSKISPVPAPIAPIAPTFDPHAISPVAVPSPIRFAPAPAQPVAIPAPVSPQVIGAPQPIPVANVAVPVFVPNTQFHAQDEFGGFSFGFQNGLSTRQESRSPDGVTRGSYSYVDSNGATQTVEYVADSVHGFRVAGTNIPVAHSTSPMVQTLEPVMDTPEVKAAKAEFQAAFDAAVARAAEDTAA